MLNDDLNTYIKDTIQTCNLHHQRMMFAADQLQEYFPLNKISYHNWDSNTIALCDQLI